MVLDLRTSKLERLNKDLNKENDTLMKALTETNDGLEQALKIINAMREELETHMPEPEINKAIGIRMIKK